ncbi:hypothetical protein, partial [Ferrovum sp.]|uniref:hypothetical protein n=1 Tax=Ferrovum sp. TaxID=2609467 RepID=UPI002612137A
LSKMPLFDWLSQHRQGREAYPELNLAPMGSRGVMASTGLSAVLFHNRFLFCFSSVCLVPTQYYCNRM